MNVHSPSQINYTVELRKTNKCVESIELHGVIYGYSVLVHIIKTKHTK